MRTGERPGGHWPSSPRICSATGIMTAADAEQARTGGLCPRFGIDTRVWTQTHMNVPIDDRGWCRVPAPLRI